MYGHRHQRAEITPEKIWSKSFLTSHFSTCFVNTCTLSYAATPCCFMPSLFNIWQDRSIVSHIQSLKFKNIDENAYTLFESLKHGSKSIHILFNKLLQKVAKTRDKSELCNVYEHVIYIHTHTSINLLINHRIKRLFKTFPIKELSSLLSHF